MNWKRPLALSTAALTLGTALAACGNPTAAAPDPTPTPAAEVQSLSTTCSLMGLTNLEMPPTSSPFSSMRNQ